MAIKRIFSITALWYLAIAFAISLVVPIIFAELDFSDVQKIGFVLFGINVVYAILSGLIVGIKKEPAIYLLFFPIIYLLGVKLFFESYAYYFSLVYVVITYLAYGITRE
ncbi:hypothetical protein JCM15457_337 [Liquorilactobacillus sucicola DSM 21376 = JCM 15457]|uniref:Integral membrane protein n=1 Tax=Liquorilactobacillus sucicola DSM 21376 = JCM 15457 TaxID=1423806 RepID=A0A023CV35_9LACO|nr:hypothetical protein [Liquorilactobacillus sucicola]KRN05398.1 hypothetical protein FD15_GL001952 [Liquorilactobacillus sucicola DSM 21376 = JCM 15457]GAJ25471.1 hypothetical protein JCM15457_337 [Liquorilactobacillus sucicola DSM 21376 = JCM 15457]